MKKIILFAMIALFVSVSSVYAADLSVSYSVGDQKIPSGGSTTISLTLTTMTGVGYIKVYAYPGDYIHLNRDYAESGGLGVGGSQQFSFIVSSADYSPSITTYVNFVIKYSTTSGEKETQITVPIKIRNEPDLQIENVTYNPSKIESGDTVEMSFILANNGKGSAKNVKISLDQEFFTTEGSPEKFIGEISSGSGVKIRFNISINPEVKPGNYLIPINLEYNDDTSLEEYSDKKEVGIKIRGDYNFIVSTEEQGEINPGSSGYIIVSIANAGKQDAEFVVLKILGNEKIYGIEPSEIYIGTIKSDDYDSEKIEFYTKENILPGEYKLPIELYYRDIYGKKYNETYYVKYTVTSRESKGILLWIVVLLVLGSIAYIKFGKKLLRKRK